MYEGDRKGHYQAVIDALPENFQSRAELHYGELRVGPTIVEITGGWGAFDRPTLKLSYSYKLDSLNLKERSWKQRIRDSKFCYDRIAGYIASALTAYDAVLARRRKGKSIATVRSESLMRSFNEDQLLSRLNVDIRSNPVHNTEDGAVRVEFRCKANGTTALIFDGERFQGDFKVFNLSAEQVTAIMAVINLDQLNILDLITLADDSILGASIKKMTAEMGDA